jgi:hypothetical protein
MWFPVPQKHKTDKQISEASEEAVIMFRMECKNKTNIDSTVKFEALAEEWLTGAKSSLSPLTYDTYRQIAPRIYKELGYMA